VHLYGGLIFATWNVDGPSFDEYLGDIKYYMDQLFCRTDNGLELLGPPQRFVLPCNWKVPGEQSGSDGFHTLTLHRSLMEGGVMGGTAETIYDQAPGMYGVDVSCEQGHSLRCLEAEKTFKMFADIPFEGKSTEERLNLLTPPGITKEMIPELFKNLSADQVEQLATFPPQVGGMFPNVLLAFIFAPRTDGGASGALTLHTYMPKGPDRVEFVNYIFAEKTPLSKSSATCCKMPFRRPGHRARSNRMTPMSGLSSCEMRAAASASISRSNIRRCMAMSVPTGGRAAACSIPASPRMTRSGTGGWPITN